MYYYIVILYIIYNKVILLYYYIQLLYNILMGVLGLLELTWPTVCKCLFKLRPGVLSKTLSHM